MKRRIIAGIAVLGVTIGSMTYINENPVEAEVNNGSKQLQEKIDQLEQENASLRDQVFDLSNQLMKESAE
jgi:peptidoglycan hydrolase CwlO-like protein